MGTSETQNILNWTKKDIPISLSNFQVRMMTGYLDSKKGAHFSKDYSAKLE